MKEIFEFRKLLREKAYSKEGFNLPEMFKAYSTNNIANMEDLKNAPGDFLDTILRCTDCINFQNAEDLASFNFDLSEFMYLLREKVEASTSMPRTYYTDLVTAFSPSKERTKILDVGSGDIPHSSIILAKEFKNVTAMDKLVLSNPCLENFNVTGRSEYFDDDTNVEGYDFIVGQRPCTAIESVVKNASSANKPYFLELCNCELTEIAQREGIYRGWEDILPEYDKDIKFYKNFAFNLDTRPSLVGHLIESFEILEPDFF